LRVLPRCDSRRTGRTEESMRYLHTMVRVADLDSALDFYCAKLGLKEVHRAANEAGRFTLVYLAAPGDAGRAAAENAPLVEITYNWDTHEYASGRNFGHLAFAVENIYETCGKLMNAGVIINRPPRDGHMAFIRSPDGISIEFLQEGAALPPQEPWASMPNTGAW
jgi:lactoylglutathione lyase